MTYILTESNPRLGFQGLVVDRKDYIATPYFDRALFEALNDSNEQYYYAKLEVTIRDKKHNYLLMDNHQVERILNELGLPDYYKFVYGELMAGNKASLTVGEFRSYTFSRI